MLSAIIAATGTPLQPIRPDRHPPHHNPHVHIAALASAAAIRRSEPDPGWKSVLDGIEASAVKNDAEMAS
jgi:hypothetical protein